ncbi:substrate-binding domain-containing protein [uncultured Thiodictyon sp.]|uniref:substrate-binding domain-containing protein n=1 Tax=uncultured Thiodictyon sp. TaxID=1846217 RepID=UPI0025D49692|nr:substrate-binding domain-containing protein [uncultured Thiodictyon sp.]
MATEYKCPNIGNCDKANRGERIRLPDGGPTTCPECDKRLIPALDDSGRVDKPSMLSGIGLGGIGAVLALVIGLVWYFWPPTPECQAPQDWDTASKTCRPPPLVVCAAPNVLDPRTNTCQPPGPSESPRCTLPAVLDPATQTCKEPPPPKPPAIAETLLRVHGSNTIGGKLLPALAEAFLTQAGYANVHKVPSVKEEESVIVGERNGVEKQIEIQAHGSKTAFSGLKAGLADIGMSSRPIKDDEYKALLPTLGDLRSNASEHVLALDGIAIIVHQSNPLKNLTLSQLAEIFGGTDTNWSQVGGRPGDIAINARDEKSGTWDFFNEAVLLRRAKTLATTAKRFEDSSKLSEAVAKDPSGIGFIGLSYVGSNKVIALADNGVDPRRPTLGTVKTEDYLLSRRLYLYTAESPANTNVVKFIEFALSDAGQSVVEHTGLVTVSITEPTAMSERERTDDPRAKSTKWRELTARATAEIGTRFRFRSGTSELDTRAIRDIGRVTGIIEHGKQKGRSLILIGFADAKGSHEANCRLSRERAEIVRQELAADGLSFDQVIGLCEEAPVASNETPEGREKNRRVEVWVK